MIRQDIASVLFVIMVSVTYSAEAQAQPSTQAVASSSITSESPATETSWLSGKHIDSLIFTLQAVGKDIT